MAIEFGAANYRGKGETIDHTPGSAVAAGEVVVQNDLVGVAANAIAANELGALIVEGVFDLPKATGAGTDFAAGTVLYWDASAGDDGQATDTQDSNDYLPRLGVVTVAPATTDTTVQVKLTPGIEVITA